MKKGTIRRSMADRLSALLTEFTDVTLDEVDALLRVVLHEEINIDSDETKVRKLCTEYRKYLGDQK